MIVRPFPPLDVIAFPSEGSLSDWIHLSKHDVADWSPTNGAWYSGAGNGIEVGAMYFYLRDGSIVGGKALHPATGSENRTVFTHAGQTQLGRAFGRVIKADVTLAGTQTVSGKYAGLNWFYYSTGWTVGHLHILANYRDSLNYWFIPAADGARTVVSAIAIDTANQDALAIMVGGYNTPSIPNVMGGNCAYGMDDSAAVYGGRAWVRDAGIWRLACIRASNDNSSSYASVVNSGSSPRDFTVTGDNYKIPASSFLYPELMFKTRGRVENWPGSSFDE